MSDGCDENTKVRTAHPIDRLPSIGQPGLNVGKANYLVKIKALIERGIVKTLNFLNSSNKMACAYYLASMGMFAKAILTQRFLARKLVEYDVLRAKIETLQNAVSDIVHDINGRAQPAGLTA